MKELMIFVKGNENIKDFFISKYQITQELFESIMGSNPSYNKGLKHPVENVSWYDAINFCNKLSAKEGLEKYYMIKNHKLIYNENSKGYRLPTEVEWKYVERGGNKSKGYKYAGSNNLDEVAWYRENSQGHHHEVGKKKPNELGIYDMNGNVAELYGKLNEYTYFLGGNFYSSKDYTNFNGTIPGDFIDSDETSDEIGFRILKNI